MTDYVSDAQARSLILDVGRRLYHSGFVASNDGNITCKVGDNAIWATPTGVSKGFMTEEMLVKMDLDGNILEGTYKPSSEIKMHLRVFKENPQVQGVVHAHPLTATAFACAGMSLDEPVLVEGILALGCVPLAHFALPGTTDVPDSIAPYCKNYNAVLLANHGALTWGTSLIQAYYRMETTEYYAKILMMNNFILGKKALLSQQQIDDIRLIQERYAWFLDGVFADTVFEKKKGQKKIPLAPMICSRGYEAFISGVSLGENPETDAPPVKTQYRIRGEKENAEIVDTKT